MPADKSVDVEALIWAAKQVVRQHTEQPEQVEVIDPISGSRRSYAVRDTGRCAQCDGDDPECWMLVWATTTLAAAGDDDD